MWYYEKRYTPTGPIDDLEVRVLINKGEIQRNTRVWKEGTENWVTADRSELASMFVVTIPHAEPEKNPLLINCPSCNCFISKRANACPQCGTIQTKECQVCQRLIPAESSKCPDCGDPYPDYVASSQNKLEPVGVRGWLLLLVVGMMVLGPLLGAGRINFNFMKAELQMSELCSLGEWSTFKSTTRWTFLVIAAISFYGGWGLARGRNGAVVKRAKAILWITCPIALLILQLIIPKMTFDEFSTIDAPFVGAFIGSIIGTIIWTAYLARSKRIRNTYGNK
jgi:RNA polymerase subunit RPABC4/transcription elongation factor Spt4